MSAVAYPSFRTIKYVNTEGKPSTGRMIAEASTIEAHYNEFACRFSYTFKYVSNPYATATCYKENSRSTSFNEEQLNYFLVHGASVKVEGAEDQRITFSKEELSVLISKIEEVKSKVSGEIPGSKPGQANDDIPISDTCMQILVAWDQEEDVTIKLALFKEYIKCEDEN